MAVSKMEKLRSYQNDLPLAKVPKLSDTLGLLLEAARPVYDDVTFQRLQSLVEEFERPGGEGEKLQWLLQKKSNRATNWLYYYRGRSKLMSRHPLHVNKNCSYAIVDNIAEHQDQVTMATDWILGAMHFRRAIMDKTLPVEYMGRSPLCMAGFDFLFQAYRTPGKAVDKTTVVLPEHVDHIRHICVMCNGHIFSLCVIAPNGTLISKKQLEMQLQSIITRAESKEVLPLGVFTTLPRNEWCGIYRKLRKDNQNNDALRMIKRSMFIICLDKASANTTSSDDDGLTKQVHHGSGIPFNSGNRWYDKTLQFIVTKEGKVGLNYEHSLIDGQHISTMIAYISNFIKKELAGVIDNGFVSGLPEAREHHFRLDVTLTKALCDAIGQFERSVSDLDMTAYKFEDFGKEFAKTHKVSMDALLQFAYQLAFYRLTGSLVLVSETCSLRKFAMGRVDHLRPCSEFSARFCTAMDDLSVNPGEKRRLLDAACQHHRQSIEKTMDGQESVDHLFALELLAHERQITSKLFHDELYRATVVTNVLFTSGLATEQDTIRVQGMRFEGSSPARGAIFYSAMSHAVRLSVTTSRSQHEFDSNSFVKEIVLALRDIASLLNETAATQ